MAGDAIRALPSAAALTAFHTRHKAELLAHDPALTHALGLIAARARPGTLALDLHAYAAVFNAAFAREPTEGGHVNALQHLAGHVKRPESAREIATMVEGYWAGRVALDHIRSVLRTTFEAEGDAWAAAQTYLDLR